MNFLSMWALIYGIANSEDPDQTAPLGAVLSGSALFANPYLSKKLRVIRVFPRRCIIGVLGTLIFGS